MPAANVTDLVRRSPLSFTGTVTQVGAATMPDVKVGARTVVMHVDAVLHAPDALRNIAGTDVTVELRARSALLHVGDSVAIFCEPTAFGETLAVREVGRLSTAAVTPHLTAAAGAPGALALDDVSASIEAERLSAHATEAAAVVTGTATDLSKAGKAVLSEHDPDWWVATIAVNHVERGEARRGSLKVLYANSKDVRWRNHPKPRAGQEAAWILHRTDASMPKGPRFVLADADDVQPVQFIDSLRPGG